MSTRQVITRRWVSEYAGLILVLAVMLVFFGLRSEHFFSRLTLSTLVNQIPALTVVAVGMTFALIIGGIDLSVGSVMAFSGALLGIAMVDWGLPIGAAMLLGIAAGLACGLVNGLVVVRWSVPSFIVTLGMLEIARGGAYLVTGSETKYIGSSIASLGAPLPALGLSPACVLALGTVAAGQVVLSRTALGRHMIAIGANEESARLSGISIRHVKMTVFGTVGALAGLGGLFQCARLSSADPNAGFGMELSAIAAVVIGGTSLMGGRGSIVKTFLGVLIIAVLQAGLMHIGASEPTKRVVTGTVIVIAVIADAYRRRSRSGDSG
jgi:ribose transport system permease protein